MGIARFCLFVVLARLALSILWEPSVDLAHTRLYTAVATNSRAIAPRSPRCHLTVERAWGMRTALDFIQCAALLSTPDGILLHLALPFLHTTAACTRALAPRGPCGLLAVFNAGCKCTVAHLAVERARGSPLRRATHALAVQALHD